MGWFTPAKKFEKFTTKYLFLITLQESRGTERVIIAEFDVH